MKIGIIIPTYQTEKAPFYLKRAFDSIKAQTHQAWKVFLVGDRYEDNSEFEQLARMMPPDKITAYNRIGETERDIYPGGPGRQNYKLWCTGGIRARNAMIEIARKEGYNRLCSLDHDDYWTPDHLQLINEVFEQEDYLIVAAMSKHWHLDIVLPKIKKKPFLPTANDLCHSATCINYAKTSIRLRDVFACDGRVYPADADMWIRMTNYMIANKLKGYLVEKITTIKGKR
jgi:glycosyltransferase involved in cell wall biosynthesis